MPTLFVLSREPRLVREPPLIDFVLGFPRWEYTQTSMPGGATPPYYRTRSGSGTFVLPEENWTERQIRLFADLWRDMLLVSLDLNAERYGTVITTLEGRSVNTTSPMDTV